MYVAGVEATISNSTFSDNKAESRGGHCITLIPISSLVALP